MSAETMGYPTTTAFLEAALDALESPAEMQRVTNRAGHSEEVLRQLDVPTLSALVLLVPSSVAIEGTRSQPGDEGLSEEQRGLIDDLSSSIQQYSDRQMEIVTLGRANRPELSALLSDPGWALYAAYAERLFGDLVPGGNPLEVLNAYASSLFADDLPDRGRPHLVAKDRGAREAAIRQLLNALLDGIEGAAPSGWIRIARIWLGSACTHLDLRALPRECQSEVASAPLAPDVILRLELMQALLVEGMHLKQSAPVVPLQKSLESLVKRVVTALNGAATSAHPRLVHSSTDWLRGKAHEDPDALGMLPEVNDDLLDDIHELPKAARGMGVQLIEALARCQQRGLTDARILHSFTFTPWDWELAGDCPEAAELACAATVFHHGDAGYPPHSRGDLERLLSCLLERREHEVADALLSIYLLGSTFFSEHPAVEPLACVRQHVLDNPRRWPFTSAACRTILDAASRDRAYEKCVRAIHWHGLSPLLAGASAAPDQGMTRRLMNLSVNRDEARKTLAHHLGDAWLHCEAALQREITEAEAEYARQQSVEAPAERIGHNYIVQMGRVVETELRLQLKPVLQHVRDLCQRMQVDRSHLLARAQDAARSDATLGQLLTFLLEGAFEKIPRAEQALARSGLARVRGREDWRSFLKRLRHLRNDATHDLQRAPTFEDAAAVRKVLIEGGLLRALVMARVEGPITFE
jgi:hypothetical protein